MAFPMKQKILIALDGERDSEWAFDWYCNNLHRPGNHVIIVSCSEIGVKLATIAPEGVWNEDETAIQVFIEEENKILAEKVSKYQKKLRSAMLVGKVLTSCHTSPSEVILNTAASEEVNMIIIGSKGFETNKQGVGSVCNYLVSHSTIPVIVCKHPDAVNDGYVSKYVVDPKTLRLIPRRRSESNTEFEPNPMTSTVSNQLNHINSGSTETNKGKEGDPVTQSLKTGTKPTEESNQEFPETETSQTSEGNNTLAEIPAGGNDLMSTQGMASSQPDVSEDDSCNDSIETTATETQTIEENNLQSINDDVNKEAKVENTVPKLSPKDVSVLLSTRLNKSSGTGSPKIQSSNKPSSSKIAIDSIQELETGSNNLENTNAVEVPTECTENDGSNVQEESDSDDTNVEENNTNTDSKSSSLSPEHQHKGHKCKSM